MTVQPTEVLTLRQRPPTERGRLVVLPTQCSDCEQSDLRARCRSTRCKWATAIGCQSLASARIPTRATH